MAPHVSGSLVGLFHAAWRLARLWVLHRLGFPLMSRFSGGISFLFPLRIPLTGCRRCSSKTQTLSRPSLRTGHEGKRGHSVKGVCGVCVCVCERERFSIFPNFSLHPLHPTLVSFSPSPSWLSLASCLPQLMS